MVEAIKATEERDLWRADLNALLEALDVEDTKMDRRASLLAKQKSGAAGSRKVRDWDLAFLHLNMLSESLDVEDAKMDKRARPCNALCSPENLHSIGQTSCVGASPSACAQNVFQFTKFPLDDSIHTASHFIGL